jgi:hypothetical protein
MRRVGEGLFSRESHVRFYGVRIQTRMAVVVLPGRRLLLYSPVWWSAELAAELAALGDPAFLVAPNKLHNQTLSAYLERHPHARLCAPPGLAERRPDLRVDVALDGAAPWGGELETALTDGNAFFREALLFHRPSRTLLVGDLVENFDAGTASRWGRALARLFGVGPRPVASPEHRLYTEDADAAAAAFARAEAWDFERIWLCHGRIVEADAKRIFRRVTGEVVRGARRRSRPAKWAFRRLASLQ